MMVSRANHLTRPYNSPALATYPAEAKEKADNGLTFWTIFRESYMGFGYNKEQISTHRGAERLRWPASSTAQRQDGHYSQRKLRAHDRRDDQDQRRSLRKKLKAQEIRVYTVSSAALVDLMASGELGASLHIYRNHAMVSAERGSSVGWVPMELVPTNSGCVGLAAQPPHPHAAALFVDYLLSPDGRMRPGKIPVWPSRRTSGRSSAGIRALAGPSNNSRRTATKWEKLAKEITRR